MPRDKAVPRAEHLDGYGQSCLCSSGNGNKSAVPTVPKVMPTPPKVMPVVQKKVHVATWDAEERRQAKQSGFPVWVQSENQRGQR